LNEQIGIERTQVDLKNEIVLIEKWVFPTAFLLISKHGSAEVCGEPTAMMPKNRECYSNEKHEIVNILRAFPTSGDG
jgi:hypothetical protein